MKVYLSFDMQGVTGVCHWDQVDDSHREYPRLREQLVREVRTASTRQMLRAYRTPLLSRNVAQGIIARHHTLPPIRIERKTSGAPSFPTEATSL